MDGDVRTHETGLDDLRSNFADIEAQGVQAYADQMLSDHPDLSLTTLRADAVLAVRSFVDAVCAP
jgi:hypothetical protein